MGKIGQAQQRESELVLVVDSGDAVGAGLVRCASFCRATDIAAFAYLRSVSLAVGDHCSDMADSRLEGQEPGADGADRLGSTDTHSLGSDGSACHQPVVIVICDGTGLDR